jgi:hypothetical protein
MTSIADQMLITIEAYGSTLVQQYTNAMLSNKGGRSIISKINNNRIKTGNKQDL